MERIKENSYFDIVPDTMLANFENSIVQLELDSEDESHTYYLCEIEYAEEE